MCLYVYRPVYVSAVRPQSKHIVVIIDHGASVTETQLQIARDAALIILNSIDEHDKVWKLHDNHIVATDFVFTNKDVSFLFLRSLCWQ